MPVSRRLLLATPIVLGACGGIANPSLSTVDNAFVLQAAAGGLGEVALGRLAQQRASHPAVREFGARMVQEHEAVNRDLIALARRKGVVPPSILDPTRGNLRDQLAGLSGPGFDQQYIAQQIQDHDLQAALFREQAQSGVDPELRAFAARTLPDIEAHGQQARSLLVELAPPARPGARRAR